MHTRLNFFVSSIAAVVLLLTTPVIATAHAEPERAVPPIDGEVDAVPTAIEIWFTEEVVEGTIVEVVGPNGAIVDLGMIEIDLFDPDRSHVTVPIASGLPPGEYTVNWVSVSGEDEDTDQGSFTFTASNGSDPVTPEASPAALATPSASPESAVIPAIGTTRPVAEEDAIDTRALGIAIAVGLVAALGIYLFWLLVKPRGDERVIESTSSE